MVDRTRDRLAIALAVAVAVTSVAGILIDDVYEEETDAWRIQAEVQDRVNLLVLAPVLLASTLAARRGSRLGELVLGGGLLYAVYNFVIYAFALRFNELFLAYTTTLGLAAFALASQLGHVLSRPVEAWFGPDTRVRPAAGLLVALALGFGLIWLAEILAATVAGARPASLEATGLLSNPVHALDLSVTLPLMAASGWWLWRRRRLGFALAPMTLVFAVLTDASIVAIVVASHRAGTGEGLGVAAVIAGLGLLTLLAAGLLFAGLRAQPADAGPRQA